MTLQPRIIHFPKIGESSIGYISVAENEDLPFEVKRIYWTYFTPESVERGGHAHYNLEQILVAVSGTIIVNLKLADGKKCEYILNKPDEGLYIPKLTWRTMRYTHNSVQISIASMAFDEKDYIREYETFVKACQ